MGSLFHHRPPLLQSQFFGKKNSSLSDRTLLHAANTQGKPPLRRKALLSTRRYAVDGNLLLVAADRPPSGDLSVILSVSVLLLSIYWVTNFVVPNSISKGSEDKSEEPMANEMNLMKDGPESRGLRSVSPSLSNKKLNVKKKV